MGTMLLELIKNHFLLVRVQLALPVLPEQLNEEVEACDSSELIERLFTLNAEELAELTKPSGD